MCLGTKIGKFTSRPSMMPTFVLRDEPMVSEKVSATYEESSKSQIQMNFSPRGISPLNNQNSIEVEQLKKNQSQVIKQ